MKNLILFSILILSFTLQSSADPKFEPPIKSGQCYANVFSKKYLEDKSTPETVFFTCTYICKDNQDKIFKVQAESSVSRAASQFDGSVMVCDGAVVVQKTMNAHTYWDFDRVDPFWARSSQKPEIKKWVRELQVEIPFSDLQPLIEKANKAFLETGLAYVQTKSPIFEDAGLQLLEISSGSEKGSLILEEMLNVLAKNPQANKGNFTAQGLVLSTILTQVPFLIP